MFLYDAMGKVKKESVSKPLPDAKSKLLNVPKKKKNSDKKSGDEWNRKFGYIAPHSVKCMGESIGIAGLSDEVANNLAEDVSYRLRSLVQLCSKYLKHTRHKRLTSEDVNEVLRMCDAPSTLGHSNHNAPHSFVHLQEPAIFLLDDPTIDLANYALNEVFVPVKSPRTVIGNWAIADEQGAKSKIEELKSEPDIASNKTMNHVTSPFVKAEEGKMKGNYRSDQLDNEPKLAADLVKYYGITCNSILGYCDLKIVLRDLSQNGKIVPIVPYLLNFITITLNKLSSERQLLRWLHAIDALAENANIDFTPYHPAMRVSSALLKIIKTPTLDKKTFNNIPDISDRAVADKKPRFTNHHGLRCRAAQVLGKVLDRWCCSELQRRSVVDDMAKIIRDLQLPAGIHVGAIALLNNLGPNELNIGLWSFLKKFLEYMICVGQQDRAVLELVVLDAAQILYRNPLFVGEKGHSRAVEIDAQLYEYFGDSLCCRRLQLTENPQFLHRFIESNSSSIDLKPGAILKKPWRLPKCKNPMYNPDAKRPTIPTVFHLPKARRKRNPRIIFKFAGANPVPEMSLRRRRLDSRYSQFIAGKDSEGHVVLVGKLWRKLKPKPINTTSLFSML